MHKPYKNKNYKKINKKKFCPAAGSPTTTLLRLHPSHSYCRQHKQKSLIPKNKYFLNKIKKVYNFQAKQTPMA